MLLKVVIFIGVIQAGCCSSFPDHQREGLTGSSWYVSHQGNDVAGCGDQKSPCCTIRYTIANTQPNDIIYIDSTGGPYINESSTEYLTLNHSLTLSSTDSNYATIQCQGDGRRLYHIRQGSSTVMSKSPSSKQSAKSNAQRTVLTLTKIALKGCQQTELGIGAIALKNADLKITDSQFTGNGVIVSHAPRNDTSDQCQYAHILIMNSKFQANQVSKPFQPGINMVGCQTLDLNLQNVILNYSPITMQAEDSLSVRFQNVTIDGSNTRSSSVDITLANTTNQMMFTNCVIANHSHGMNSAMSIAANQQSRNISNLHMSNVTFKNNVKMKTIGGALSVFARFSHKDPLTINLQLSDVVFLNNSARNNGGAMYIENVGSIKINSCQFINNTAVNGGAISVQGGKHITITNSIFTQNAAISKKDATLITLGGALYVQNAELFMDKCKFYNNYAQYDGLVLYTEGSPMVSIQNSYFEHNWKEESSPWSNAIHVNCDESTGLDPLMRFNNNMLNWTRAAGDQALLDINAPLASANNVLQCAGGHHVEQFYKSAVRGSRANYAHLVMRCRSCPEKTYSSEGGASLEKTMMRRKIQQPKIF